MADSKVDSEPQVKHSPPFIEVECKRSGKIRRFAVGTDACFAVNLINKKLLSDTSDGKVSLASHIEAVKEGEEEPVIFGPNSLLVDYGSGWKLQTVVESNGDRGGVPIGTTRVRRSSPTGTDDDSHSATRAKQSPISPVYIGKILLAFLLMFAFAAVFTLALESLPSFILYINSSV